MYLTVLFIWRNYKNFPMFHHPDPAQAIFLARHPGGLIAIELLQQKLPQRRQTDVSEMDWKELMVKPCFLPWIKIIIVDNFHSMDLG
jgi:hypothetical protein